MKTQQSNLFNAIIKTQVEQLTIEVSEAQALEYTQQKSKTFSAAELWNIQRRHKSMNERRRFAY
jgi:hypothetical protein